MTLVNCVSSRTSHRMWSPGRCSGLSISWKIYSAMPTCLYILVLFFNCLPRCGHCFLQISENYLSNTFVLSSTFMFRELHPVSWRIVPVSVSRSLLNCMSLPTRSGTLSVLPGPVLSALAVRVGLVPQLLQYSRPSAPPADPALTQPGCVVT